MSFYFYTETAFHHEGDYDYLVKLIDESKDIGVNGIKFQVLFELNSLTSSRHNKYNELSKLIFDQLEWKSVFERSINYGLDLIVMPLDCSVFELINQFKRQIKYLELHSVSFNDENLKSQIKDSKIPLILGIGGRTLDEIEDLLNYFNGQVKILMHGFQS